MKRSAIVVALAFGLMAQGAMAKTLNVVSSFSVLGDMVQQVGGEHVHVDTPGRPGWRSAHLRAVAEG